ncbi:solute carrier family 36 (proton-coupled amino acid transporter) [Kwoniella heveanensis BCC8398]|uniref:Solute carrier family 36 (Proton-coupled amino acid transporter) n=1 Tax=Kwoniella heveanensis BCC8398 TaxID=1296120 RepID=A0A1B9GJU2_9TREE|nr:solute carrier family 36 (proton-coupled amino acid transporter) [Kwoniella heveanensis BCC8398]
MPSSSPKRDRDGSAQPNDQSSSTAASTTNIPVRSRHSSMTNAANASFSTSPNIARSLARAGVAAGAGANGSPSGSGAGTPAQPPSGVNTPPIPNIPPRAPSISQGQSGSVAVAAAPKSLSTSYKSPLSSGLTPPIRANSPNKALSPKPSSDNMLGRKQSPTPASAAAERSSALTASMGSASASASDAPAPSSSRQSLSRQGSGNLRPSLSRDNSNTSTPRRLSNANKDLDATGAGDSSFSNLADVTNEEKAKVLRRHLVSADERGAGGSGAGASKAGTPGGESPGQGQGGSTPTKDLAIDEVNGAAGDSGVSGYGSTGTHPRDDSEQFPIPYDAVGGDVTHDLYKWQHEHRPHQPVRSASFSHIPLDRSAILDPTLAHIKEPGGFRRNFVVNRAQEQGLEAPTMVRNVVDFLFLYGHFAGEDLNEDDDVDEEEEEDEESFPAIAGSSTGAGTYARERAPLLGATKRGMSMTRHRRTKSGTAGGTASTTQAILMLLKGFVGTGILFMGKAFFNGGILFSAIVMVAIAFISLWSFLLLVQAYMKVPGSFGDIGGALYGNYMRLIILTSITVSQIGFVAAYTIFIAENLQAFFMAVTDCKTFIPVRWLIFGQLIVFLPLAMVRNLAKLSGTALVADAFILIGIVYIGAQETSLLSHRGIADVQLFNAESFPLLIGTAVFAFEGIGLVIPITESMKEPQKFPRLLSIVMTFVAVLFAGAGVMSYATYGSNIQTVVIVNLPQENKFVQAVQFLYSVAILLSIPLQLFPAVRIMENGLFSRSGKHNPSVKWQKNVFRGCTVLFCSLLSWAGSSELDKFVSLIGSFACIPLCFIYPPMLHLKACNPSRKGRILDWILIIFGTIVGAYTTVQTVRSLAQPGGESPKFGNCEVPDGL